MPDTERGDLRVEKFDCAASCVVSPAQRSVVTGRRAVLYGDVVGRVGSGGEL